MTHTLRFVASFANEDDFLGAARACKDAGATIFDAYTPYPVHGLDAILGIRRSRLPWVTLLGGAAGLLAGLALQYWTSASDWPLNVGGKPLDSFPAFVPVAFELTILLAGLATIAAVLGRSQLLPFRKAAPAFDRATDDRFVLVVARISGVAPEGALRAALLAHHAVEATEEAS